MSFLERIRAANTYCPEHFIPFDVAGERLGRVKHEFARVLSDSAGVFQVSGTAVRLSPRLASSTPARRTEAIARAMTSLSREGYFPAWRDELYPVSRAWAEPPRFLLERAVVPYLGVGGYSVHMNGYVRGRDGLKMWISKRSADKPTDPGKLDQLVAGGQPARLGLLENLIKECHEEAGIPADLARRAVPVGAVTYAMENEQGFRPDTVFVFDLRLPSDFRPRNRDGEVESFSLAPIAEVMRTVRDTTDFKFNCALVIIDFLVRHGMIPPEHPDYVEIVTGLRGRPVDR